MSRVTALLGAGACIDIRGPRTDDLTNSISGLLINDQLGNSTNFIELITQQLNHYYNNSRCNFEDIFHAIEELDSYRTGIQRGTVKEYKPALGAFINQIPSQWLDPTLLMNSADRIIGTIAERISVYDNDFCNISNNWFRGFWLNATSRSLFDIATLNYDTCIEQTLRVYEDGFENTRKGFFKFNLHNLLQTKETRVFHPHGCIVYGYLPHTEDPNQHIFEYGFHDLFKYNDVNSAQATWFGRSNRHTLSHEKITVGPIITGLRKTDKILTNPYSSYYYMLQKAIIENNKLLIIGYSFNDMHFNDLLERFTNMHADYRIVMITYCNPDDWCEDPSVMDWMNDDMYAFVGKSFKETEPFRGHYSFTNPLISKNGRVRIYFTGFRNTVERFGNEIIDFLAT